MISENSNDITSDEEDTSDSKEKNINNIIDQINFKDNQNKKIDEFKLNYMKKYMKISSIDIIDGMKVVFWEHLGLMSNPRYRKTFRWKLDEYESVGIYPGKNLIITFEGDGHFLSSSEIEEIIKSKIL